MVTRKLIVAICCSIISMGLQAQDFINEDFLDDLDNNTKALWADKEPAFSANSVPAKFNKESATVIGYRRSVNIDKKSRNGFLSKGERSLIFYENVRFKILVNDRNAVKNFTTIYFRYNDKEDGFSAKITKPGEMPTEVKLNEAVGIESYEDMPEFFKSFFDQQMGSQRRYYKVAIPDLEPGDILEYVTVSKNKLNVMGNGYIEFTPQYEFTNKKYPILFNQIIIETDDKSYFKSLSINGAPEFKKEAAADAGFFRYVFTDRDRPVEKDVNFVNLYKVSPMVKFQVIYANNEKVKGAFIGQKGEIKSGFSKEELAKTAWEDYVQVGATPYGSITVQKLVDLIWYDFKKQGAKDWSEKDYINKVYYKLRNIVVNRDTYLNDKTASFIFGSLLYQRDIKSDLIISVSNNLGSLDNVLFEQEIRYICKVKDKLYFNCTDHTNPEELLESLVGSDAYIISEPQKNGNQEITAFRLPATTVDNNVAKYTVKAAMSKDMGTVIVNRTSAYTGISKHRHIDDAMKYTPYMLDDYKIYGGYSPTDKMRSNEEEEYHKSVKALKENFKKQKPEFVKAKLSDEYSQKAISKDYLITSDGRTLKKPALVIKEEFELPQMVRKAGQKYLVNVAGLVGGQLLIKKDEKERNHDITMGYARMLLWEIDFKIPEGYTAEGLKELAANVSNDAGVFTSEATEANGVITLKITKVYKENLLPKDKWQDVLAFVDAAYKNSYKYILLKPKS